METENLDRLLNLLQWSLFSGVVVVEPAAGGQAPAGGAPWSARLLFEQGTLQSCVVASSQQIRWFTGMPALTFLRDAGKLIFTQSSGAETRVPDETAFTQGAGGQLAPRQPGARSQTDQPPSRRPGGGPPSSLSVAEWRPVRTRFGEEAARLRRTKTPEEWRLLALLDGSRLVGDVARLLQRTPEELLSPLQELHRAGLIDFKEY